MSRRLFASPRLYSPLLAASPLHTAAMKYSSVVAALGLTSTVSACLLERERSDEAVFRRTGQHPNVLGRADKRQSTGHGFPIGNGDRFKNGCTAPVGLGIDDRNLKSILNVGEVTTALEGLANVYKDQVELFTPPFETYENRTMPGAAVGKNPRVFIMSGIHARERGGPDTVVYFLADLLAANKAGTGLDYGGKKYTNKQVKKALSAGIVVMPITNPDGVAYDQETDSCWRKNRNPESSNGAPSGRDIGIDLNRNYDFIWDFEKAFTPDVSPASNNPASEVFCGTEPESEAETKAVVWALDQYKDLTWMLDLHSYGPSILYAWGDDETQTKFPKKNFVNDKFDGKRGYTGGPDPPGSVYKEYFTADDLKTEVDGTDKMIESMLAAGNVEYTNYPAVGLYPTSGASNDYAMGRYYGGLSCGHSRMFGLTLEFGSGENSGDPACPFYTTKPEYHNHIRQVSAGFMEMMLLAAGPAGEPLYLEC